MKEKEKKSYASKEELIRRLQEGRDKKNAEQPQDFSWLPVGLVVLGKAPTWLKDFSDKISPAYRTLFQRTKHGLASPRQAIKAMCQQCVGYENVAEAIHDCRGATCPLYAYRPYQTRVNSVENDTPELENS